LGIAVGMATKIPPHNLGEVMEALIHLADNPKATTEDLLEFIKGPDFPTAGVVYGQKDIEHAYTSGRGGVVVRGEAEIIETKTGSYHIIISSLPYQINKAELIIKMAELVQEKKIEGIRDIRDESTGDIRIVVELKNGAHPQKVLNSLYKHTELETVFHYNMLALVAGVPELLSLERILSEFLKHRDEVITFRTKFDLARALEREHILIGLKKALDVIDAVIKTIRKSKDVDAAEAALIKEFDFTVLQARAILDMRLQRLANLERQKVLDELAEKQALIKDLKGILADPKRVRAIMKAEFKEVVERYGDARRLHIDGDCDSFSA
jgi:DNA gyrase subunit A